MDSASAHAAARQPVRVAITGAQGSGKSALAQALASLPLPGMDFSPTLVAGIGSDVQALGLPLGETATAETIQAFAARHLERERASMNLDAVVFDRCMLDTLAYSQLRLGVAHPMTHLLHEMCIRTLPMFDLIAITVLEASMLVTVCRRESTSFRMEIQKTIVRTAGGLSLRHVCVGGPTPDRCAEVVRNLTRRHSD